MKSQNTKKCDQIKLIITKIDTLTNGVSIYHGGENELFTAIRKLALELAEVAK